jgi:SRSO17 transposase
MDQERQARDGGVAGRTDAGGRLARPVGALCDRITGRFKRVKVRARMHHYLQGLPQRVKRKMSWQLAKATGETQPAGVQRLLRTAVWDADGVRDDLQTYVCEALGDPASIAVIDETGFLKKGT